jgi:polysaccharide biosynthesis transport protein
LTSSEVDEVVIDMYVTDSSPERAADVANTAATVLSEVVDDLERPQTPGGIAPVAVRVVQPATVPARPSSTGLTKTVALGLLTGLALGVGGALIRNALDTSVTSPEQLESLTGAPVLGSVAFDRRARIRPLVVHDDPNGPQSEAFRQLRTNLQSVNRNRPAQVVLLTSSTHGEGNTTTVVNLATALASVGQRVLVIEADLRNPKLAGLLQLNGDMGLTDVLMGRATSEKAIKPWSDTMVSVMPSGSPALNPTELLAGPQMKALVMAMRGRFDAVLIDTPPLLPVTDAAAVASVVDGVVLVCKSGKTTSPQVAGAMTALSSANAPVLGTVLTSVRPSSGLPLLNRRASPAVNRSSVPGPAAAAAPSVRQDLPGTVKLRQHPEQGRQPASNGHGSRPSPRPVQK